MTETATRRRKLLYSFEDLQELGVKLSRVHIQRLIKAGKFPAPIKLGDASHTGRVAWIADEFDEWLEARKADRAA